jgi:hypothetical protein
MDVDLFTGFTFSSFARFSFLTILLVADLLLPFLEAI